VRRRAAKEAKKRYSWARPWLERLPRRDPATFVEAARDPSAPAHPMFTWDNSVAANEHRLTQARVILANLMIDVVIVRRSKPETVRVRAIHRTSRTGEYDTFSDAFSQPVKRDYVLSQALAQLSALKRRYAALSELAIIFAAFDKVVAKHSKRA
jgi:hypothetical protein